MYRKLVKELMIPVAQYPTVHQDSTMYDALVALSKANQNIPEKQQNYRAVLVRDDMGKIVGKIGYIAFLKALEPKYQKFFDTEKLSRLTLSNNFIDSMIESYNLWMEDPIDLCTIASNTKCYEIMNPIEQRIEENETIAQAIHKLIMWQTLSILVSKGDEIVGIIRLSDIYDSIEHYIIHSCNKNKKGS